jgi:RimJ/RimL family protein N-acetyltransferase
MLPTTARLTLRELPENAPSQRVATRLGMRPIEEVQFHGLTHIVFAVARPDRSAGGEGDVS